MGCGVCQVSGHLLSGFDCILHVHGCKAESHVSVEKLDGVSVVLGFESGSRTLGFQSFPSGGQSNSHKILWDWVENETSYVGGSS